MAPPLLIVNPACGANDTARSLPRVLAAAENTLGDVAVRETSRRGHARQLALEGTLRGHPVIVAVGGDGTLSEVVDGVMAAERPATTGGDEPGEGARDFGSAAERPAVGLVSIGTGGDFRRTLGLDATPEACLEAIASGRERTIDVGRASFVDIAGRPAERHFVNVLSAGLGGLVDRYVETSPAFLGGRAAYYLASLRAVIAGSEQLLRARLTWDGETREKSIPAYLVAICNGRWFGGGMDVAPMASPDDGRFEVLTITERNRLLLAYKVRTVYSGRHLLEPTVNHFPCRRIDLRLEDTLAERRFLLDVDGDALGSLPLSVEVLPGALRVRA